MDKNMFDGFRHEEFRDEVEERWGKEAYARSDAWWSGKSDEEKRVWQQKLEALNQDWQEAHARGEDPLGETAQAIAQRHINWLRDLPTEMLPEDFDSYVRGLAEMYVNDPRFAGNYGGEDGAAFVRDALNMWLDSDK